MPTPKPEPERSLTRRERILLTVVPLVVFAGTAGAVLRLVPGQHTPADNMIVGTLATLLALVTFFGLLLALSGDWKLLTVRRRRKADKKKKSGV